MTKALCTCLPILPDSDVAEAMEMLKGLKFAKELLFLNIQAESDSSNVIMAIKDKHLVSVYLETIANVFTVHVSLQMFCAYIYWEKFKFHIEQIRLLMRVYKKEALLTLWTGFARMS